MVCKVPACDGLHGSKEVCGRHLSLWVGVSIEFMVPYAEETFFDGMMVCIQVGKFIVLGTHHAPRGHDPVRGRVEVAG